MKYIEKNRIIVGNLLGILSVIITAGIIFYLNNYLLHYPKQSFLPVFLLPVIFVSFKYDALSGIAAAFVSILSYNFLLKFPHYEFTDSNVVEMFSLIAFIGVSIFASVISLRICDRTRKIKKERKLLSTLISLNDEVAKYSGIENVVNAIISWLSDVIKEEVFIVLADDNNCLTNKYPEMLIMDNNELKAAKKSFNEKTSFGAYQKNEKHFTNFIPLYTSFGEVGVLGIRHKDPTDYTNLHDKKLLDALSNQISVAIERSKFADSMKKAEIIQEREKLRNLLLSSISHDLKTPLAAIIGGCSAIQEISGLKEKEKEELIEGIREEAERLHSHISNILRRIKLDSEDLILKKEKINIGEVIYATLKKVKRRLSNHKLNLKIRKDIPDVYMDFLLIQEVLQNILDNAVKYSPDNTVITIETEVENNFIVIKISDEGEGIPEGSTKEIFDKFYRIEKKDSKIAGTGLGLSICKAIIKAHNGTIKASNSNKGAVFDIKLPVIEDEQNIKEQRKIEENA